MRTRFAAAMLPLLVVLSVAQADVGDDTASDSGFGRAVAAMQPRVVKLYGLKAGQEPGYGSGIIISEDGIVLTVFSLLIDARRIRAVTSDGMLLAADVIYRDRERQLALVRMRPITEADLSDEHHADTPSTTQALPGQTLQFPFFDLSEEADLRPGDWVLAGGNAFKVAEGAEPVSLVHGVFSARTRLDAKRRVKDFPYRGDVLVIDAITSNPGAPGGALVTLDGRFLGLIGREVTSNLTHTHFNYAIPRDVLQEFWQEAQATIDPETAMVPHAEGPEDSADDNTKLWNARLREAGIRMSQVGYKRVLPFVERVQMGSAAGRAGVRKDDLILSVNGRGVADMNALRDRMGLVRPDDPIDLVIRRGRRIVSIRIDPLASSPTDKSDSGGDS